MSETTKRAKRFGTIAVEHQFVTSGQITTAMEIQVQENINTGQHRRIGAILFEEGLMTAAQIQTVIGVMISAAKLAV